MRINLCGSGGVCLLPIKSEHRNLEKKQDSLINKNNLKQFPSASRLCIMLKRNVTNTAGALPRTQTYQS